MERAMTTLAIVVSGIVFGTLGYFAGYIVGFIDSEHLYKIKHGEKP
jgi:hypothetical protein